MKDRISERIEYINTGESDTGSLFDLSATGACCHGIKRIEKDTIVSIKINELLLKAKVVYCQERRDGFRIGLQFLNVTAELQKAINDCVTSFSRGVAVTCGIIEKT
jgi:hypothetical protein